MTKYYKKKSPFFHFPPPLPHQITYFISFKLLFINFTNPTFTKLMYIKNPFFPFILFNFLLVNLFNKHNMII